MKIKLVIVDLEIPPPVKRWGFRIGIPLGLVLGGGAVAWAAGLTVWTTGQTLQAADLNANFAYLATQTVPSGAVTFFNLAACPTGWTAYAPAEGRGVVGLVNGGTLAATVGTALTDQENRATGQHAHTVTDPGHTHGPDHADAGAFFVDTSEGTGAGTTYYDVPNTSTFYVFAAINTTSSATTGVKVDEAGTVAGTNAPYVQLLACQKD